MSAVLSSEADGKELLDEPLRAGSFPDKCWVPFDQLVEGQLLDGMSEMALNKLRTELPFVFKLGRELLFVTVHVLKVVVLDVVEEPFGMPGI